MAKTKSEYIMFNTEIETDRKGRLDVCTRIDDMEVTDKELLEIKEVQERAAKDIEKILNTNPAAGE